MVEYITALNVAKEKILEEVYHTMRTVNHMLNNKDIDKFAMIALIHIMKKKSEKIDILDAVAIEKLVKDLLKQIDDYVMFPENE
jgi:hypothetical protein